MVDHPLPIGTRVTHVNQQWATSAVAPEGTAEILEACGPYNDGTYEYLVLAARDFSRRSGPENPLVRETRWSSQAVRPCSHD